MNDHLLIYLIAAAVTGLIIFGIGWWLRAEDRRVARLIADCERDLREMIRA
jgi:hypothetical protein